MLRKALLTIAAGSLAQTASSEIRETAPGRFECEAAPGRDAQVDVSDFFGPGTTIAARIRFIGADHDERSDAAAALLFRLDDGTTAKVIVLAPPDNPDSLFVMLTPPDSDRIYPFVSRRRASPVEISATMARGAVFVRSRNERGQIYVERRTLVAREIMCSSGRFEIELTRDPRSPRRLP